MGALASIAAATAATLVSAPTAFAGATTSSNWAGYAIHRSGVSFRSVEGTWIEPSATCTPGMRTYSSYWVGLGGYKLTSQALEQIGTEVDCKASGQVRSTAWYELVPEPSVELRLIVRPGDLMRARVAIHGHHVTLSLYDETRKRGFHKKFETPTIDVSSAEWIVEAPSECLGADLCQALPLADFGSAEFGSALARSTTGEAGTISSRLWSTTEIKLLPGSHRFVSATSSAISGGAAFPSGLSPDGNSFAVDYSQPAAGVSPTFTRLARSPLTTFVASIPPR